MLMAVSSCAWASCEFASAKFNEIYNRSRSNYAVRNQSHHQVATFPDLRNRNIELKLRGYLSVLLGYLD